MLWVGTKEGVRMAGGEDTTDMAEPDTDNPEPETDTPEPDTIDPKDADRSGALDAQRKSANAKDQRRVSVTIRTLLVATLIGASLASAGVLAWLYLGARAKVDADARQVANNSHAERIALDYAVDAAKINVEDLDTWKKNLVKGTTSELKEKLSSAGKSMEQILVPLQWNSTAIPLVAKVRSNSNGIYVVDTFVGVQTKTMQAPEGVQSTATYSITIDSNHDWQISDVGGIGAVVGQK